MLLYLHCAHLLCTSIPALPIYLHRAHSPFILVRQSPECIKPREGAYSSVKSDDHWTQERSIGSIRRGEYFRARLEFSRLRDNREDIRNCWVLFTGFSVRPRLFPFISRNWNLTNKIRYFLEYDITPLSKVII
jgi:hypothetical protein